MEVLFKVNTGTFGSDYVGMVDHEEAGGWGLNLYKSADANKPVLKAELAYGSTWNTIEYTVEVGKWYHAVMTYDGNNVSLYINGELVKTDTLSAAYRAPNFGTNCYVCIGACAQQWRGDGGGKATGKSGFMGDIADVNIHVNPLTEAEIKALYAEYAELLA
ncbi:MAG: LamG domain-containing protein [Clostridia bacterium]|nr:LamG domain-containing protein [Clostridia bacterium]